MRVDARLGALDGEGSVGEVETDCSEAAEDVRTQQPTETHAGDGRHRHCGEGLRGERGRTERPVLHRDGVRLRGTATDLGDHRRRHKVELELAGEPGGDRRVLRAGVEDERVRPLMVDADADEQRELVAGAVERDRPVGDGRDPCQATRRPAALRFDPDERGVRGAFEPARSARDADGSRAAGADRHRAEGQTDDDDPEDRSTRTGPSDPAVRHSSQNSPNRMTEARPNTSE